MDLNKVYRLDLPHAHSTFTPSSQLAPILTFIQHHIKVRSVVREWSYVMGKDNARQFLEQLCHDAAFRAEYRTSGTGSPVDIMDYALTKGFVFTMSELREALLNFPSYFVICQMCDVLRVPRQRQVARTA
jgi:hypothetical protein